MGVDASIYGLVGQGVTPFDPVGSMGKAVQLQMLMAQKQEHQLAMRKAAEAQKAQGAIRDLFRGAVNPDGSIDENKMVQGLAATGYGDHIQDFLKGVYGNKKLKAEGLKDQTTARWASREAIGAEAGSILELYKKGDTQGAATRYRQTLADAKASGEDTSQWPQEFDPAFVKHVYMSAIKPEKQADLNKPDYSFQTGEDQTLQAVDKRSLQVTPVLQGDQTPFKVAKNAAVKVDIGYSLPFEATDPKTGEKVLVQQDKKGNLRPVQDYKPKETEKPMNESQGAAFAMGKRAAKAQTQLGELEADPKFKAELIAPIPQRAANLPGVGNFLASPQMQRYMQAKRNFISAILRKESGAAISAPEFESEDKKYFPQPGDSDEVIKQKAEARALAIEVLQDQAGRPLDGNPKGTTTPAAPGKVVRSKALPKELGSAPPAVVEAWNRGDDVTAPDGTVYKKEK